MHQINETYKAYIVTFSGLLVPFCWALV